MSIILFIILLTFLIVIHELGHFFVALWCRVKVEEFGIGLPPKAKTLFRWRGVPFTLNWIFLGGFVRMEGEDGATSAKHNDQRSIPNDEFHPFYQRPLAQKLAIVVAGPAVNFFYGIVAFVVLYTVFGIPKPVLLAVAPDSPASQVGLQAGDIIHGVRTLDGRYTSVVSNEQLVSKITARRGEQITLSVERDGKITPRQVYVRNVDEIPQGQGSVGLEFRPEPAYLRYPLVQQARVGVVEGMRQSLEFGISVLSSLGSLASSVGRGNVPTELAGPVGIAYQAQRFQIFSAGIQVVLNFSALLSINLAIMNLLPIPALDGGRAVLLVLEKFFKGKRFVQVSNWLNTAGFLFLISLLLLITLKDVIGIVVGR